MSDQRDQVHEFLIEGLARSRSEEVRARQTAERAQRATSVWSQLLDYQAKGWPAHIASLFIREAAYFHSLENSGDERWTMLGQLRKDAHDGAKAALRRFPADIERACDEAHLKLDSSSRHPRYTIRNFIRIEVDDDRVQAKITPRDGDRVDIPVDVPAVVQHLVKESTRLFEREFDSTRFLRSLLTAYQAALREESRENEPRKFGEEIPLRRVIHRMSKNLSHFKLDEFNIDLATAIRQDQLTVDDHRLHVGQTRNTRQGMLLHGMEESGYVGFISFRKS